MCFGPEMLAALALSGAGQYINASEANSSAKAQINAKNASLQTELARQKGFQDQSNQAFQDTLTAFKKPEQDQSIGDIIFKNTEALQANQAPSSETNYAPITGNAPKVVQSTLANTLATADAKGKTDAANLAKLRSTNDQLFGNSVNLNKGNTKIGTISNFAGNSANINQAEQREAFANAKKNPSGIGDILGLAGTAVGLDAGTGGRGLSTAGSWWNQGANFFPQNITPGAGQMGPIRSLSIWG